MEGFSLKRYAKKIERAVPNAKYDPTITKAMPPWFGCGSATLERDDLADGIIMFARMTEGRRVRFGLFVDRDYRTNISFVYMHALELE
jgi:hypothetical protein